MSINILTVPVLILLTIVGREARPIPLGAYGLPGILGNTKAEQRQGNLGITMKEEWLRLVLPQQGPPATKRRLLPKIHWIAQSNAIEQTQSLVIPS